MNDPARISDAEIHAFIDGELTIEERKAFSERLGGHREDADLVAQLEAINRGLAERYAYRLEEPVPEAMQAALLKMGASRRRAVPWRAIAAALLCAVIAGAGGYMLDRLWRGAATQTVLAEQALGAHSVYVGEVRHPVEVAAAEETHLVQWLTRRVGATIRAPQLGSFGFHLVGGRLLPDQGRPAAQFMFEDTGGRRLTLYVRKETGLTNVSFSLASHDGLEAFYWIEQPLAYAVVGRVPRDELLKVARAIYEQLH
jgi:anti-sigma factor RsiW